MAAALALLLAGCAAPGPARLAAFGGEACTEAGITLAGDPLAVAALLPPGFAPAAQHADEAPLVAVAVNRCAFEAGGARVEQPEAFVWVAVEPPPEHRLAPGAPHAWQAMHWRPPGPLLEAMRGAGTGEEAAWFEGFEAPLRAGAAFAVTVRPGSGGLLRLEGAAGEPTRTLDHPEGPCCRTFAQGRGGVVRIDYASADQPQGEAPCTLATTLPALRALLGRAEASGTCVHNAGYAFRAEAWRAD